MAAIYQADVWCDDCAKRIKDDIYAGRFDNERELTRDEWEVAHGFDDERNYDSDEYPKGCDDDETCDCPQHCAAHDDCVNAHVCADGTKIGYFFENALTSYGEEYVRDTVCEYIRAGRTDSVACTVWAPYYDWIDWGSIGNCTGCGNLSEDLDEDDYCEDCAECMASDDCDE